MIKREHIFLKTNRKIANKECRKVGLGSQMAYCLAWHIGLDGRSEIIPQGYNGIH